ncbi:thrombospondin-2-like [Chironomus tepperi]|uniref:thrombospondin-2-like n=1 Tax=Chironomus tepperi TaxID=113505 RepID=UPI00391FCA22
MSYRRRKTHNGTLARQYTCTAFNHIGQIQKTFHVKIEIPIQYTPWSKWSECNIPCGSGGIQYRKRSCILEDASTSYNCSGETIQRKSCNEFPCPINGGWNSWSVWSECPSCYDVLDSDKPIQRRTRSCDSPTPSYGGVHCRGNDVEERECEINVCNIDGGWSDWTDWSACSTTCERGIQVRYRYCNNPEPTHNGKSCSGHYYETKYCMNAACEESTTRDYETESSAKNGLVINVYMKNSEQKPEVNIDEIDRYAESRQARPQRTCRQGLRYNSDRRRCERYN